MLRVGSLFAGIGGFDLGFERAGMETAWFCEQDEFCRAVLAKHWPDVRCYPDVTTLENPPYVDVLCGGFPCQDLSTAGKRVGIEGTRSGLWSHFARLIGEVRPRYVVMENVAALRYKQRGFNRVLGDLAALGFDAEWSCIPASAVGAPHRRDRIWLVAYPERSQLWKQSGWSGGANGSGTPLLRVNGSTQSLADSSRDGSLRPQAPSGTERERAWASRQSSRTESWWWESEPDVGRVAHGVPARVDRLAALGNALVPQIAEWIGQRIVEVDQFLTAA